MKRKFLLLLLVFHVIAVLSQPPTLDWGKSMGGTFIDAGKGVVVDSSHNVITTGTFYYSVDFDPGPGTFIMNAPSQDCFVSKLNTNGDFIWAKQIGANVNSMSLTLDESNSIYVCGYFTGTSDFDPGMGVYNLTSVGNRDIFICKLDSNGTFVWAKAVGSPIDDWATGIRVDGNGDVCVGGYYGDTVDFDPGTAVYNLASNGYDEIFVLKLDSAGNFVWAKSVGGAGVDRSYSLTIDSYNDIYVTGLYVGTVDFDPSPTASFLLSAGGMFILKLSASGNFHWAKSIGTNAAGFNLFVDGFDNLYATGPFSGTVDFDPSSAVYNVSATHAAFIAKYDLLCNLKWAKAFNGDCSGYSVAVDSRGDVFTVGTINSNVDLDPGPDTFNIIGYNIAMPDLFLSKLDNNGTFLWGAGIYTREIEDWASVTVDAANKIYLTANYRGTCDFDPSAATYNMTATPSMADIFIIKLSDSPVGILENTPFSEAYIFPNPATDHLTIANVLEKSLIEVFDTQGCCVFQTISSSSELIINSAFFTPGLYLLKITPTVGRQCSSKFIIQ